MYKDEFLKEIAIILIVGIIVNGACFLMGTIHSHAMTSIYQLPYNLANFQSINQPFSQYTNDILTAISNSNFVNASICSETTMWYEFVI